LSDALWPHIKTLIMHTKHFCLKAINSSYCSMQIHYWVTTLKQTMKQQLLLCNTFLISKYTQPLLSNPFTNKYVSI
jgi:hypothetical protein